MTIPVQVTFRGMDPSGALRDNIEEHAAKLEQFSDRIIHCRVVVEQPVHNHRKGNHYRVHVQLEVPGRDIQVGREPAPQDRSAEDVYVVVRDSFDAARRQLEDYERERRGL